LKSEIPNQIGQQIMLPWGKSLAMTKNNITVRLGRSIVTASGIFLGIAFLSSVLTGTAIMLGARGEAFQADAGLQARNIWLVTLSLVVSTVGVVNSMLMAVTERYREIGTMKCLGALDRFIVRLFLLESGLLGFLGSLAGGAVGFGLSCLLYGLKLGWSSLGKMSAVSLGGLQLPLGLALGLAVALGTVLSVLAALYPAWRAARMPPAAALRTEV
jgi:ABC-type lipoprotein release transport system permease subunit